MYAIDDVNHYKLRLNLKAIVLVYTFLAYQIFGSISASYKSQTNVSMLNLRF